MPPGFIDKAQDTACGAGGNAGASYYFCLLIYDPEESIIGEK